MSRNPEVAYQECQQRAAEFNAQMNAGLARVLGTPSNGLQLMRDPVADQLDELADLAEVWKRRRQNGQSADSVRVAMLNACGVVAVLKAQT